MKKVLITGATGYLGSRFVQFLSEDKELYLRLCSRNINDFHIESSSQIELCHINLLDLNALKSLCSGIDTVIHLAGMNAFDCGQHPVDAIEINTIGTKQLLDASLSQNVRNFIYFSTAHIYGSPLEGRITEENLPRPSHPYSISKRCAEDFVLEADRKDLIKGYVLRLSNGFGYPIHKNIKSWGLLVNDVCRQIIENQKIVIHSDGTPVRDFIPLSDICGFLDFILNNENCSSGIYNLGSGQSMSIRELVERIVTLYKQETNKIIPVEYQNKNTKMAKIGFHYSIDKLLETGFMQKNNIDFEILETIRKCNIFFKKDNKC